MFVVCCLMVRAGCMLMLVVRCALCVVCSLLFDAQRLLRVVCCVLFVDCCVSSIVSCLLCVVCCVLFDAH